MPRDLNVRATTGPAAIDRKTLFRLLQLLWPRGEPGFRLRFALTIGLLAGAALLNALVPLLFAAAVDHLSVDRAAPAAPPCVARDRASARPVAPLSSGPAHRRDQPDSRQRPEGPARAGVRCDLPDPAVRL